jgi:GTPase
LNSPVIHKAGFVNILGKPNVGKSTLMNALVGEKLSIITPKAQTTRHRILGIVNGEDFQIVYSDTPGILEPNYKLQEIMLKSARSAMEDADIVLFVTEVWDNPEEKNEIVEKLKQTDIPVILILNKIDISSQEKVDDLVIKWQNVLPNAHLLAVSALHGHNITGLLNLILEKLPENPPYFPKDELTDRSERFFASEIIREKILLNYRQELPYATEIDIEAFKDEEKIIRISAVIYVERETQKGIIIGSKGSALKKTGTEARLDMEKFFGKKVFLELFVKVRKDWRNNDRMLRQFGYN